MAKTWAEFIAETPETPSFLVDPIIPDGGTILLHGPTSIGKSPYSWGLAKAIASGSPFLGMETRKSRVSYLELDTPESLVWGRLKLLEDPPEDVLFSFLGVINILSPSQKVISELKAHQLFNPSLVIVNTLRKCFLSSANDSDAPAKVIGAFQGFFPHSAILLVHHDRKESSHPEAHDNPDQMFSGTQAWADGAQVGLHLMRSGKNLRLDVTKSQVCEKFSLSLKLESDGSHLTLLAEHNDQAVREILESITPGTSAREMDKLIASRLGVSERTARSYRLHLSSQEP